MKTTTVLLLAVFFLVHGLYASGQKDTAASSELTLYYSHTADWTDPIIKKFQDRTGIKVNRVGAGTGELVSRIQAEKDNPQADILWGGGSDSYQAIVELLQPYAHEHMKKVLAVTRDPGNRWHGTTIDPMVLIYNTKLVAKTDAPKGWADLLNPKFKGSIAYADPAHSGSSFMALVIQLLSMGGDNEVGWTYMKNFVANLEGAVLASSSAVYEGVADGEYAVGITYEEAALKYERAGANLKVVYPLEGSSKVPSPIAIVKGAKNLENAQKFVDFILSKDIQALMGDLNRRTVRTDVELPSLMIPNSKLGEIPYDTVWVGQNKARLLEQWESLFTGKR